MRKRLDFPRSRDWGIVYCTVMSLLTIAQSSAQSSAYPDEFLLEVPGDPSTRSTAEIGPRGLLITDARGQAFEYQPRPELDSEDGNFVAFYSPETRRYVRWPVAGHGPMILGTALGGNIAWRRSQMQVRPIGGRRVDPLDLAERVGPNHRRFQPSLLNGDVAAASTSDGSVWVAQVDDDGTMDLFERREKGWRHREFALSERLPASAPVSILMDDRTDAPRLFAINSAAQVVEVSRLRLRELTTREVAQFPRNGRLTPYDDRFQRRQYLLAVDTLGRIWQLDPDGDRHEMIEPRAGLFEPGSPVAITMNGRSTSLFLIDRSGRLLGYSLEDDGWSRPFLAADGLVPGGSVAAAVSVDGPFRGLQLAAVDSRGLLHVWQDTGEEFVDQLLPNARFQPGCPVAMAEIDQQLCVTAISVEGRWMEWRQSPAGNWSPYVIADGFATGSTVVLLPEVAHAFAVDRTGRVIAGWRNADRWECHVCSPGLDFAPRLERRSITPNDPLPTVQVNFDNTHNEELVLKLHDIEKGGAPVELRIGPGESQPARIQRSSGATLEESFYAPDRDGRWVENVHRVPLPPRGRYTVTVYASRQTSVYFDRTRNKGPVPDEASNSLVSLGVFVLPPGSLLDDGVHIDIYREVTARANPGEVILRDGP